MANDLIPLGRPRNSEKKDFNIWPVGGRGGGGGIPSTAKTRYTFWLDHNVFATAIKKIIAQNVNFQVFSDPAGNFPVPFWLRIEQSNDCPSEIAMQASEIAATKTLYFSAASIPPYYLNTNFTGQPTDFNYQNDQGRYAYNAYSGNGFGLAKSGSGAFDAIFQSFVPQSPVLTGLWIKRLFRVGSQTDHTLYSDLTVGLYDSNLALVGVIGKLKKNYPMAYGNNPPVLSVNYNTVYYVTADDAQQYWVDIDQVQFIPDKPLPLKPNDTYYIGIMPDTFGTAFNYAVGSNADPTTGNYGGKGRYIFGQAFSANKTGAVFTSVSPIGTDLSIGFTTQRNTGRTAYTFIWQAGSNYMYDPDIYNQGQFQVLKEDFDQRI